MTRRSSRSSERSSVETTSGSLPRYSTSEPLHYMETTCSDTPDTRRRKLRMQRKITVPEPCSDVSLRRSTRTRVIPLEYWRSERLDYRWDKSAAGFNIAGIVSPTPTQSKRLATKKVLALVRAEKQRQKKSRLPPTPRNLSIHKDLSSDEEKYQLSTRPDIPVVKSDGKEVFMDCVKAQSQFHLLNIHGKPPTATDELVICKPMRQPSFAAGQLTIRPLSVKRNRYVQNDTMVFTIVRGKLAVTIHRTKCILESGDMFFVPVDNAYSIENLRNEDAKLVFTQIRG